MMVLPMSTEEPQLVKVYACKKRPETYLYVTAEQQIDELDDALLQTLGELRFVLDVELHSTRRLANADPVRVLAALADPGYYLQVPPPIAKVEIKR